MVKILEIGGGRLDAEEDDDCCEIDPAEFAKKLNLKASDDDDVVVVAAKGPVALKDFPHPRYLCGNYPFDTTPHESRCRKCYCSLCEVPASSCLEWKGTEGHCHGTK
ncbi:hypothetical protein ACQJBY_001934 [Aegilops geniculata]